MNVFFLPASLYIMGIFRERPLQILKYYIQKFVFSLKFECAWKKEISGSIAVQGRKIIKGLIQGLLGYKCVSTSKIQDNVTALWSIKLVTDTL